MATENTINDYDSTDMTECLYNYSHVLFLGKFAAKSPDQFMTNNMHNVVIVALVPVSFLGADMRLFDQIGQG